MNSYLIQCITGWWALYWHTDEKLSAILQWKPIKDQTP